ncbi:hypothetical protein EK21DRAFT_84032 [Setomelanomma holmii]|uniref:RRM domain-containing protein n=1 Tax=Setomelanomma holmii TaxID=210430 RepID=A0A9P4HN99_9PLEO|nr:hypothetical protein EK21DRAFT_84032 [Setomelanomma holmii]
MADSLATSATATSAVADEGPTLPPSPVDSDKTVVAHPREDPAEQAIMPDPGGSRRALFSTELGTRPPRDLHGPPFPPVIARSNKVQDVVQAAKMWREKFPLHALGIFPDSGWTIEDLWDATDIYMDTPQFCQDVLNFIARDNFWSARKYAEDYAKANPKRVVEILGQKSMEGIYEPANPLAIVDKIFVGKDIDVRPRQFLWHAANIMRSTMIQVQQQQKTSAAVKSNAASSTTDQQAPSATEDVSTASQAEPPIVNGSAGCPAGSVLQGLSKTNRKKIRSRPQTLTSSTEPSGGTAHSPSAPALPLAAPAQPTQLPLSQRVPSYGPPQQNPYQGQPMGPVISGMPSSGLMSPSMHVPALRNPKGRIGYGIAPYTQHMPSGAYTENSSRGPSGGYSSRPPSGNASAISSPHMNPAVMSVVQPGMVHPQALQQFPQAYPPMSPSAFAAQPYHAGFAPGRGMMNGQQVHMPSHPSQPIYAQQVVNNRNFRGKSIGDVTNNLYYTNYMPPQNMDSLQPTNRRNSFYNVNSVLFDPYNGTRPAFNDPNSGRKYARGNYTDQSGRPRRSSGQDNRLRTSSYGTDRPDGNSGNGNRYHDHRPGKANMVDDLSITGNSLAGCGQNWIGPSNREVNELFVNDLPEDVRPEEIRAMFLHEIGIEPCNVTVGHSPYNGRPHAFALFNSYSNAQSAIRLNECSPRIRDALVRVTVPRRFYQKSDETASYNKSQSSENVHPKAANAHGVTHRSSHEEEHDTPKTTAPVKQPLYSPQDARSDLQKKVGQNGMLSSPASAGSPESRKLKSNSRTSNEGLVTKPMTATEMATTAAEDDVQEAKVESKTKSVVDIAAAAGKDTQKAAAHTAPSNGLAPTVIEKHTEDPATPKNQGLSDKALKDVAIARSDGSVLSSTAARGNNDDTPQPVLELDSPEVSHPIVNIPAPAKDSLPSEEQEPAPVEESAATTAGNAFEEEGEPDSSFLSAQETMPSAVTASILERATNDKSDDSDGSKTEASNESSHTKALPPPDASVQDDRKDSLADATIVGQATSAHAKDTQERMTSYNDVVNATPSPSQPFTIQSSAAHLSPPQSTVSQPSEDAGRRQGPQQTASLNPFAKPSKTQRQKEKEQQKKEKKKKEQLEKATKAKVEKSASSNSLKTIVSATATGHEEQAPAAISKEPTDSAQPTEATVPAFAKLAQAGRMSIGKAKVKRQTEVPQVQTTEDEHKKEVFYKHRGSTISTSSEAGSVTQKLKVSQKAPRSPTTQHSSAASAPTSPAQSPNAKLEPDQEKPGRLVPPPKTAVKDAVNANDVPTAPTMPAAPTTKKTVLAVPELRLRFSVHGTTSQAGMSSSTQPAPLPSASSTAKNPSVQLADLPDIIKPTRKSDGVSVASSDTLLPDDPAQPSPSPTAEDFHTPLQTPADLNTTLELPVKSKKNKKKNKKKKVPATDMDPTKSTGPTRSSSGAPDTDIASTKDPSITAIRPAPSSPDDIDPDDAFADQLKQIDSVRKSNEDAKSYFNKVNKGDKEKAAEDKGAEDKAEKKRSSKKPQKFEQSHWFQIQEFLHENPALLPNEVLLVSLDELALRNLFGSDCDGEVPCLSVDAESLCLSAC